MKSDTGSNIQNVKASNRILALKHIAIHKGMSRIELARITGLSKMTAVNIVNELLAADLITETDTLSSITTSGRKPVSLTLSPNSPCICGILIKRELIQIILSDLGCNIFYQEEFHYKELSSSDELLSMIENLYRRCSASTDRRILAIGISCLGPLDTSRGLILDPPLFYGIKNLPIVSIIEEMTGLPVFLVHDATAGAFSEKLLGIGRNITNFVYLHIINGIGAGLVLNNALYDGDTGQSGEIEHTCIDFHGPACSCGSHGCLGLYTGIDHLRARIQELSVIYPGSPLSMLPFPEWRDIITAGNHRDPLALTVLEEFCSYIAYALTSTLSLLNLSTVIVGYSSDNDGDIIEELLSYKLNTHVMSAKYQPITVTHSSFKGNAPLIGSVAIIADKVFSKLLPLKELENTSSL